ncbi:tubulin polymerization-promoting protein family member 2-like, partial [Argonauta hians]
MAATELQEVFCAFTRLAGAKTAEEEKQMNSKACAKMVKDCLPKELVTIADASVFPKYKEKNKNHLLIGNFSNFIRGCAHEYAKIKTKNTKLTADDPEVEKWYNTFVEDIKKGRPNVKEVKVSKTGNVEGLTDTSQYTGSHKERFDEEGKGKGMSGRKDEGSTSGYVGAYKGEGTFDKDKK